MAETALATIHVQVTLHRDGPAEDVALIVPLVVELPTDPDGASSIDDVLDGARSRVKDLLRPYLNNQAYFQVDTPAIPHHTNGYRAEVYADG